MQNKPQHQVSSVAGCPSDRVGGGVFGSESQQEITVCIQSLKKENKLKFKIFRFCGKIIKVKLLRMQ